MKNTLLAITLMTTAPALAAQTQTESAKHIQCSIWTQSNTEYTIKSTHPLETTAMLNGTLFHANDLQVKVNGVVTAQDGGTYLTAGALAYYPSDWSLKGTLTVRNHNNYTRITPVYASLIVDKDVMTFKAKVNHQALINGKYEVLLNDVITTCTLTNPANN
ncbi:MAG TPA: hypothetical protein VGE46_02810 [Bdellovibrio sp.]